MSSIHLAEYTTGGYPHGIPLGNIDGIGSARLLAEARRREMLARTGAILTRREKFREYVAGQQAPEACESDSASSKKEPSPLFEDDFEFFGDPAEFAEVAPQDPPLPPVIDWAEWEALVDFFDRLQEYPIRAEEPASLRVMLLGEVLRRKGFEAVLFYDDSGVGLSVCSHDPEGSFDICEISQQVLEAFSNANGARGCRLAHMEIHAVFERPQHGARTTEMRGDFLFTIYGS